VFNEKGELIGIATSSIDSVQTQKVFGSSPQNVNFAIKSSYIKSLLPNLPDAFIRDKGIVVVPAKEVGFKERVKSDIVLVEAVPEFKPAVVKRDYEDEGRLREERSIAERERKLREREQRVQDKERELEQKEDRTVKQPKDAGDFWENLKEEQSRKKLIKRKKLESYREQRRQERELEIKEQYPDFSWDWLDNVKNEAERRIKESQCIFNYYCNGVLILPDKRGQRPPFIHKGVR
jgi:flagellar biosynthesis GTPase FlhF